MSVSMGSIYGVLGFRDQFTGPLEDLQRKVAKAGKDLEARGRRMTEMGTRLTASVTLPILGIGAAFIKSGMDAVESENLFEVSFGGMAGAARRWSEETSEALKLNEFALRRNSATIFTMVESMGLGENAAFGMATGITELAGDLASFFNLRPEEAFDKLRSGIVGETEPLRRLGILVDENTVKMTAYKHGLVATGEELTQQQKVQARWLAILEQTGKAQGDLARTLDSPTNRLRAMKEEAAELAAKFGIALLPMFEKVLAVGERFVDWTGRALERFTQLPKPVQAGALALAALAAAAGPLLIVVGSLTSAVGIIGGSGLAAALGGVLGVLTGPAGIVLAIGAAVAVSAKYRDRIGEIFSKLGPFGAAIAEVTELTGRLAKGAMEEWVKAGSKVLGVTRDILDAIGADAVWETWIQAGKDAIGLVGAVASDVATGIKMTARSANDALEELEAQGLATAIANHIPPVTSAWKRWSDSVRSLTKEEKALAAALDKVIPPTLAAANATDALGDAHGNAAPKVSRLDELLQQIKNRLETDWRQSWKTAGEAINDSLEAAIASLPKLETGLDRLPDKLEATGKKGGEMVVTVTEGVDKMTEWTNLAQIFADAWGTAFDDMADGLGDVINQLVQLMAMMKELVKLEQAGGSKLEGAIAGAGFGASTGSFIGQFSNDGKNYAKEIGAIGGMVGAIVGSIFPVLGTALGAVIGSIAGSLIGSFIKKGADEGLASIRRLGDQIVTEVTKNEGGLGDAIGDIGRKIVESLGSIVAGFGGDMSTFAGFDLKIREGIVSVFINGITKRFEDVNAAIDFAVSEALKQIDFSGSTGNIKSVLEKGAWDSIGDLQAMLGLAQKVDLGLMATDMERQLFLLNQQRAQEIELAKRAGISLEDLNAAYMKLFDVMVQTHEEMWNNFIPGYSAQVGEMIRAREETYALIDAMAEMGVDVSYLAERMSQAFEFVSMQIEQDLITNLLKYTDNQKLANRLAEIRMKLEIAQMRMQLQMLKQLGVLTRQEIRFINRVINEVESILGDELGKGGKGKILKMPRIKPIGVLPPSGTGSSFGGSRSGSFSAGGPSITEQIRDFIAAMLSPTGAAGQLQSIGGRFSSARSAFTSALAKGPSEALLNAARTLLDIGQEFTGGQGPLYASTVRMVEQGLKSAIGADSTIASVLRDGQDTQKQLLDETRLARDEQRRFGQESSRSLSIVASAQVAFSKGRPVDEEHVRLLRQIADKIDRKAS